MASYFGIHENNVGSFFSNMTGSSTGSVGLSGNLLSDYASIKSGSYHKLLKAYYAKVDPDSTSKTGKTDKKDKISANASSETKILSKAQTEAEELKDAATALTEDKKGIFELKETEKKDEVTGEVSTVKEYDRDAMYQAVKSFVEEYNGVLDSVDDVNSQSVLRAGVSLLKTTQSNEDLLNKAGITIGKGNKLMIEEEAFKKADINVVKSLFKGRGSYADSVASKSALISGYAKSEMVKSAGSYNANGSYRGSLMSGSIYDSFF